MTESSPKTIYLKNYQVPTFTVDHINLDVQIFDDHTNVTTITKYKKNHGKDKDLILNGEGIELKNITLDANLLTEDQYELTDTTLTIKAPLPDSFELETIGVIHPESNTALEGLYKSGNSYCTQCEAEGFRRITWFQDRPDVMAKFTTRVEACATKYPVLLSNGNPIEEGPLDGGRHYTIWDDPFPKPCYLFALVAGDLLHVEDSFTTAENRTVTLRIYVREGDEGQCDHAMESLKKSMKWDEDKFGRIYEYDRFNIVAVRDFNMGAMENTSLNIFNTALVLAHPETATDADFINVESVIGHEYFHNWTGNRITCRDWFQLTLKEGLTVFRDQEFSADMQSPESMRISDVGHLRAAQFSEDAGPMAHPIRPDNYIEINNFYTMTVYEKGAEVIRMMHTMLGAEMFRKAMDIYFERHDGQAVTCEDFVQCMEDASDLDLTQFKLWYSQAGTPQIKASSAYDETKKTYTLTLEQTVPSTPGQDDKKPMHIPVSVGLLSSNGNEIEKTKILHLKEGKQDFTFEDVQEKPTPSILRNFSAPVKLTSDLKDEDLRFLMVHDTDSFNRWESCQTMALRILTDMIDKISNNNIAHVDSDFVTAIGKLIEKEGDGNRALLAKALIMPEENYLALHCKVIDPMAIYRAREQLISTIAKTHWDLIESLYDRLHTAGNDFGLTPDDMANRALRNICLRYLSSPGDEIAAIRAKNHYFKATNMTDRVAALSCLGDMDSTETTVAFEAFHEHFKEFDLVINKWFSLQAMSRSADTINNVKQLMKHADFDINNPNRVRALIGAFCVNNQVCFHDISGAGYKILGDIVLELNTVNPQIAARLLTTVRQWKKYTPDRRAQIQGQLERIANTENLSPDVFEVVTKTLKG